MQPFSNWTTAPVICRTACCSALLEWLESPGEGVGNGDCVSFLFFKQEYFPLGSFHAWQGILVTEQALCHLLKESTYLSGGLPESVLSLTLPLGQSLFRP